MAAGDERRKGPNGYPATADVIDVTLPAAAPGHHTHVKRRVEWIDLVKACSVLLVVFMHATNLMVDVSGPSGPGHFLQTFNAVIEPLRMPAFFLVSGMLAASAIHRPWRATTRRTTGMVYLYVVWMVLFLALQALFGVIATEPVQAVLFAKSGYWYLYAMALFFVIARLLRHQPAWVVVAVAVVPNLLRPEVDRIVEDVVPGALYTSMAMNLSFFLLGAYFSRMVAGIAEHTTWVRTVVLGAVAVPFGIAWMTSPGLAGRTYFPVSVLMLAFGVSLAVQITRNGAPRWAGFLAARTLPIYVWQWPVIFLVGLVLPAGAVSHPALQLLFPFALTALVAGTAVWLHRQPALGALFTPPSWVLAPQNVRMPAAPAAGMGELAPEPR
jgi:surface polysaccharide O-acyltransferase-like enzyme